VKKENNEGEGEKKLEFLTALSPPTPASLGFLV